MSAVCLSVCRQLKADVQENKRAMHKLRAAAESAKHTLSTDQLASVHLESLHQGLDFQCTLTRWLGILLVPTYGCSPCSFHGCRGRVEGMCSTLFRKAVELIPATLEQAGITEDQLDYVRCPMSMGGGGADGDSHNTGFPVGCPGWGELPYPSSAAAASRTAPVCKPPSFSPPSRSCGHWGCTGGRLAHWQGGGGTGTTPSAAVLSYQSLDCSTCLYWLLEFCTDFEI